MRKENVVIVVLLVVILALLVWMNLPKSVGVGSTVNVTGSAKTTILKDLTTVTVGVRTTDKNVKDALSKNNTSVSKVINALKGIGIKEEDIQTSLFDVSPAYNFNRPTPIQTGFTVVHDLTVTVKTDHIGDVINVSSDAGANAFYNLNFKASNEEEVKKELLDKALLDARAKAEEIAKTMGKKVIDYKVVSYEYVPETTMPNEIRMAWGGGGGPEIEPGKNEISVNVYVTFLLK